MQQVIWNLVSNALKFTPDGGRIALRGSLEGDRVQLVVCDIGQGIDGAKLRHIFDMFWQAEPASSRSYGGLGLGLSIAQRLVELHGGEITATSDGVNTGTAFVVRLPIAPAAAAGDAGQRTR